FLQYLLRSVVDDGLRHQLDRTVRRRHLRPTATAHDYCSMCCAHVLRYFAVDQRRLRVPVHLVAIYGTGAVPRGAGTSAHAGIHIGSFHRAACEIFVRRIRTRMGAGTLAPAW